MSNLPPPPGGAPPPPPPGGGDFPPPPPPPGGAFAPPPAAGYQQPYGQATVGAPYASFGVRLGAFIIDGLIVAAFNIPGWIVLFTGPKEIDVCPGDETSLCEVPTDTTTAIAFVLFGVAIIAGLVYYSVLNGRGATIGKRSLGIRVADINTGQPIGTGRGVGRYFASLLSAIPCYLGYFWMLWDDKSQCWQDKMVSSVVVRDR